MTLPVVRGRHADEVLILDVETGEALDPHDATDEQIARWRVAVLEWEQAAREAKHAVDAVMLERLDADASWTRRAGRFVISAPSPAPSLEYPDPAALRRDLLALDELSEDAVHRAVELVPTFKVRAAGLRALRALDRSDVDALLEAHAQRADKPRRVTVKEAGA